MKRLTTAEFIERATTVHGHSYDYSLSEYRGQVVRVKIICPSHGEFFQRPADHMRGVGCPNCGSIKKAQGRRTWTPERFLDKAREIHGDKFQYDISDFSGANGRVTFRCEQHGWHTTAFATHIYGKHGCPACSGKKRRTTIDFVNEAEARHGARYDYSECEYKNGHTHVKIKCPDHGVFLQTPICHARLGQGCPYCAAFGQSKSEALWLDRMGVSQRLVRKDGFCFDGYYPVTNTVFEFYGDFWHGNPTVYCASDVNRVTKTTFGELYWKTRVREDAIKKLGYNLVVKWESDFLREQIVVEAPTCDRQVPLKNSD